MEMTGTWYEPSETWPTNVPGIFDSPDAWAAEFAEATVHLQWDPERTLRGAGLPYFSIQVGLSRHVIGEYVEEWIVGIEDITNRVKKMYDLMQSGHAEKAKRLLPSEKIYPLPNAIRRRLHMGEVSPAKSK